MKTSRNILVLVLCLVMALGFAACSQPAATEPTPGPATQETEAPAETGAPEETPAGEEIPYWRQPMAETVTLTCVKGYNAPEDPDIPSGTVPENSAINYVLEEKLNIKLEWLWSVPNETYEEKFALAIASGAIPDLLWINVNQFLDFVEAGQLADLGPALEAFAMPAVREEYSYYDDEPLKQCTYDGKLLSIPSVGDNAEQQTFYYYRHDWLDDVNMDVPNSIQDVNDFAVAAAQADLSGTGETVGLISASNLFWGGQMFCVDGYANGFGAYPKGKWIKMEDGSLAYGGIQPEVKDALDSLRQLYADGGISREFVSHGWEKMVELLTAGKAASFYGAWYSAGLGCSAALAADLETDWRMVTVPSTVEGVPGKSCIDQNVIVFYNCLSKDAMAGADEAFVKVINVGYDINYASPSTEYNIATYGETTRLPKDGGTWVWNYAPIYIYQARTQAYNMDAVQRAWEAQDDSTLVTQTQKDLYNATAIYTSGDKSDPTVYADSWAMWFSRVSNDSGIGLAYYNKANGLVYFNRYYGPPTATQLEKESTLMDLQDQFNVAYVMGQTDDWDGFVQDWLNQGGDAITAEVNSQYVNLGYADN